MLKKQDIKKRIKPNPNYCNQFKTWIQYGYEDYSAIYKDVDKKLLNVKQS